MCTGGIGMGLAASEMAYAVAACAAAIMCAAACLADSKLVEEPRKDLFERKQKWTQGMVQLDKHQMH